MKFKFLKTIRYNYRLYGSWVWDLFKSRLIHLIRKPFFLFRNHLLYFKCKKGFDFGGPSPILDGEIPIYPLIEDCQGSNFNKQFVRKGLIHVFIIDLLKKIVKHFNLKMVDCSFAPPYHQIVLAVK